MVSGYGQVADFVMLRWSITRAEERKDPECVKLISRGHRSVKLEFAGGLRDLSTGWTIQGMLTGTSSYRPRGLYGHGYLTDHRIVPSRHSAPC